MNGCFSSTKSHRSGRCLDNSSSFQPPTSSTFYPSHLLFLLSIFLSITVFYLYILLSALSPSPSRHQTTAILYNGSQPSHAFHGGPRRPRRPRWHGRHVQHEREYRQSLPLPTVSSSDSHRPQMLFTWDTTNLCIVFRQWHIRSNLSLVLSLFAVVFIGIGYEYLRSVSRRYEASLAARLETVPSE